MRVPGNVPTSTVRRIAVPAVLLVLLSLLVIIAAGCERRSQQAPAADAPSARILATAGFGAEPLMDARVPPGQTVMRALRGTTDVDTRYAGAFVSGMFGRRSDLSGGRDWFLFVNGLLSPVGAKDVDLAAGDEVWWDYRDWSGLTDTWAVVGEWPRPFIRPAPAVNADPPLDAALADAGARLTDDAEADWRVRVGAAADLSTRDAAWRRAVADPGSVGLTVTIRNDRIEAYDGPAGEWRPVDGARALIAAVPTGTVDLPTTRSPALTNGSSAVTAASTYERSAAWPSRLWGVPTPIKCSSDPCTADISAVKRNAPEAIPDVSSSWSPGSKNGAFPADRASTFLRSTSTPTTSCPIDAIAAACTAPR